ncbi:MAG TPA: hypothetical protein PKD90_12260 [Phnomibacter sp.]|nr:hypothetical protein [Phnomibacter sp.]
MKRITCPVIQLFPVLLALIALSIPNRPMAQPLPYAPADSTPQVRLPKTQQQYLRSAKTLNTLGWALIGVGAGSLVGYAIARGNTTPNPNAFVNIDVAGMGWLAASGIAFSASVPCFIIAGSQKRKAKALP